MYEKFRDEQSLMDVTKRIQGTFPVYCFVRDPKYYNDGKLVY